MSDIIYLDGKKTDFKKSEYNYINEGQEVEVYRYKDNVFKIFKQFSRFIKLDKQAIEYLKNIDTERYLLPTGNLSTKDKKTIGYASKYKTHYPYALCKIGLKDFIRELTILKEDTDKLSDAKVGVRDIHSENYIYDGSIYISDPGNFIINDKNPRLKKENIYLLNDFIIEDIIGDDILKFSSKKKKEAVINYLREKTNDTEDCYIADVVKENITSCKTLRNYTKKLVKTIER